MACFHPMLAYRDGVNGVKCVGAPTAERLQCLEGRATFELPCGHCIGCRQVRVRAWSLRCMHEAQMYEEPSSFVTLTYADPDVDPCLNYRDFQRFMYRVRRSVGPTRFFMCGEYGEVNLRPHFHAILFGRSFDRRERVGDNVYRSRALELLWPFGISSVGDVTRESAGYVAGYALKKVTGDLAGRRYSRVHPVTGEVLRVVPEFGHMSLKPGIGYPWFVKYFRDVFAARDGVVVNGKVVPPPRFYLDKLADLDRFAACRVESDRQLNAGRFECDRTPERLADRERCAVDLLKRRSRDL